MQTRHTSRTNIWQKRKSNWNQKQMVTKWNRKYACSEKDSSIQDIFYEVGKRNYYRERDRPTFSALNQLLSGHSILNSHRAKIDKNFSSICDNWQELEDVDHFVFHCGKYTTVRNRLERRVEDILWREGCNDVTCIDLKLLGGYNENVMSNGQNELISALMEFIRCSHIF